MRLLIISPAQVMMDPGSAALWHWGGTDPDFFILSSQQAPNQQDDFFFFFSWADAANYFLVRVFMLGCKYLREVSATSFPSDLSYHLHTRTHTPLFYIILIGAQGIQALPSIPLFLTLCVLIGLPPCFHVTFLSVCDFLPICQFTVELNLISVAVCMVICLKFSLDCAWSVITLHLICSWCWPNAGTVKKRKKNLSELSSLKGGRRHLPPDIQPDGFSCSKLSILYIVSDYTFLCVLDQW